MTYKDKGAVDSQVHDNESFGSDSEGENLHSVGNEVRGQRNVVESVEEGDHCDDSVTSVLVGVDRVVVGIHEFGRLGVDSTAGRPD